MAKVIKNLNQTPDSQSAQMNNAAKDDCLSFGSGTYNMNDLSAQLLANDPGSAVFYGVRGAGVALNNGVLTVADGTQSFEYAVRMANGTYSWATVNVAQPTGPELVANGSFEQTDPSLITQGDFADWAGFSGLPGWTNENGTQLEVVNSGYAGIGPVDGTHWLDSQDSPAPIDISQLLNLATGTAARMTFVVSAENVAAAGLATNPAEKLDITFGGQLVRELTMADFGGANPSYNAFQTFTATIVGGMGDASNMLEIASKDASGFVGFAIDSVSVKALDCCCA